MISPDDMIKRLRRFSLREIGLTQEEAADLLATTAITIGRQERGDSSRGPITGALEYLLATWPLLTEEQRDQVTGALLAFRNRRDDF